MRATHIRFGHLPVALCLKYEQGADLPKNSFPRIYKRASNSYIHDRCFCHSRFFLPGQILSKHVHFAKIMHVEEMYGRHFWWKTHLQDSSFSKPWASIFRCFWFTYLAAKFDHQGPISNPFLRFLKQIWGTLKHIEDLGLSGHIALNM